jgi:hypothetical protein
VRYEARRPTLTGASAAWRHGPRASSRWSPRTPTRRELSRTVTDAEGRFSLQARRRVPSHRGVRPRRPRRAATSGVPAGRRLGHPRLRLSRPDAARPRAHGRRRHGRRHRRAPSTSPTPSSPASTPYARVDGPDAPAAGRLLGPRGHHGVELLPRRAARALGRFCSSSSADHPASSAPRTPTSTTRGSSSTSSGTSSSTGCRRTPRPAGAHPAGYLIDPGLAWEEGRATWFSSAVRATRTTRTPSASSREGSLRVDHDLEHPAPGPRGIGNEMSVSDVLWDLIDGVEGYPTRTTTASRSAPRC